MVFNMGSRSLIPLVRSVFIPNQRIHWDVARGHTFAVPGFNLRSAFDQPFTNDVVLEITPLLYRVDTNGTTAHLVEFPPVTVELKADGGASRLPNRATSNPSSR